MNMLHIENFLPFDITHKSFIKPQFKLKPFYTLHCGDSPVAHRNVQSLSEIDVAD